MDYTLLIENLPFSITKQYLETLLSEVAVIKEIRAMSEDQEIGETFGVAFAIVPSKEDAEKIIEYIQGKKIKGRFLKISLLNK